MPKFKLKPVEVEAIQVFRNNMQDVAEFTNFAVLDTSLSTSGSLGTLLTRRGNEIFKEGDYIVKMPLLGFLVMIKDDFESKYDPAD